MFDFAYTSPLVFFNDTATTEIYTLSLHDALPISPRSFAKNIAAPGGRFRAASTLADRKSTRLNSSHVEISYAVFCLKKNKDKQVVSLHARVERHAVKPASG